MFPAFHPFLGLDIAWVKALIFLTSPYSFLFFVSVAFLAVDPAIPLHCTCYCFTYHFTSCYPVGLRVDAPTVPTYFFINLLLRASLVQFPHLYLFWALLANIHVVPTHFIISFLKLSRPIYFFFTSFTFMGFLLDPLGFLGPITTSLPLVTFRAYWPLSQTNEFTNSFSRFLWPIYFLLTSYYSHGLTISFLGLPWPIYSLFTSFYFLRAPWPPILPFQLVGLTSLFPYYFSFPTFSILLGFFCC